MEQRSTSFNTAKVVCPNSKCTTTLRRLTRNLKTLSNLIAVVFYGQILPRTANFRDRLPVSLQHSPGGALRLRLDEASKVERFLQEKD